LAEIDSEHFIDNLLTIHIFNFRLLTNGRRPWSLRRWGGSQMQQQDQGEPTGDTAPSKPGLLRRFLDALYLAGGILSGLFLIAVLLLMMALSLGRPLGINIPSGDDFAAWSMAAMSFLGLAYTFKSGDMIRVGLLIDRFEGRKKQVMEITVLSTALAIIGFFAWHAVNFTYSSWFLNDRATGILAIPLWIPQLGYCGGLVLLTVALVDELVNVLMGGAPRYVKPKPKTTEELIEQAMQSAV
jgi:TRAP-type C4-dicarboxylate transport system permease small subunit